MCFGGIGEWCGAVAGWQLTRSTAAPTCPACPLRIPHSLPAPSPVPPDVPPPVPPQDAHEFLNWLLNDISEVLEKEGRAAARRHSRDGSRGSSRASSRGASPTKARSPTKAAASSSAACARSPSLQLLSQAAAKAAAVRNRPVRTWVHDLFQVRLPGSRAGRWGMLFCLAAQLEQILG